MSYRWISHQRGRAAIPLQPKGRRGMLLQTTRTSPPSSAHTAHSLCLHTVITKDPQLRLPTHDKQIPFTAETAILNKIKIKLMRLFYPLNGMIIKKTSTASSGTSVCFCLWKTKTFQAFKSPQNELCWCPWLLVAIEALIVLIKQDTLPSSLNPPLNSAFVLPLQIWIIIRPNATL